MTTRLPAVVGNGCEAAATMLSVLMLEICYDNKKVWYGSTNLGVSLWMTNQQKKDLTWFHDKFFIQM